MLHVYELTCHLRTGSRITSAGLRLGGRHILWRGFCNFHIAGGLRRTGQVRFSGVFFSFVLSTDLDFTPPACSTRSRDVLAPDGLYRDRGGACHAASLNAGYS
jgi:hypothetical protein